MTDPDVTPSTSPPDLRLDLAAAFSACRDSTLARVRRWVERVGAKLTLGQAGQDRQATIDAVGRLAGFFGSSTATTALNLPWIPLFLLALALIHPAFLLLVAAVSLLIWGVAAAANFLTVDQSDRAQTIAAAVCGCGCVPECVGV